MMERSLRMSFTPSKGILVILFIGILIRILSSSQSFITSQTLASILPSQAPIPATHQTELADALRNVVIDPVYSHAAKEHPQDVPIVRSCFATKGAYLQWEVEKDKRYLRACIVDEVMGIIAFQIVDIVERQAKERTAYIKAEIKNIQQLLEYALKKGYTVFTGPL